MKHVETKKHMQMAELLPHLDLPPTELERLRLENKKLKEQLKITLEKLQIKEPTVPLKPPFKEGS